MSQEKVNDNKNRKLQNKSFHAAKKRKNIITVIVCILAAAAIGVIIYFSTRPTYSVSTATSAFDDAAIATLAGLDYDFSQFD